MRKRERGTENEEKGERNGKWRKGREEGRKHKWLLSWLLHQCKVGPLLPTKDQPPLLTHPLNPLVVNGAALAINSHIYHISPAGCMKTVLSNTPVSSL